LEINVDLTPFIGPNYFERPCLKFGFHPSVTFGWTNE
jgi:hypothetical protein